MLRIKLLLDEIEAIDCALNEEQKVMTILGALDEQYNSVFLNSNRKND